MKTINDLKQCTNMAEFRAGLQALCAPFGPIVRLDVLQSSHEGTHQAICFLRMATPAQEYALMHAYGVGRFGGEIAFAVDLDTDTANEAVQRPSSQWADLGML